MTRIRSVVNGFTLSRRSAVNGFTLVEMLVALMIFAMLGTAGILLLRSSLSAQADIAAHLDDHSRDARIHALIAQDLAAAVPRISRTQSGLLAPAFFARAPGEDGALVHFVRSGWANPDDAPRASVQKVEYHLREGRLERVAYPHVDGAQPMAPAVLLDGTERFDIAFRAMDGQWRDTWQSPRPTELPVAARIRFQRTGGAQVTWMFLVGGGRRTGMPDEKGGTDAP